MQRDADRLECHCEQKVSSSLVISAQLCMICMTSFSYKYGTSLSDPICYNKN